VAEGRWPCCQDARSSRAIVRYSQGAGWGTSIQYFFKIYIYITCVVRWEVVARALIWTSLLLGSLVCQEFGNVCTSHRAGEQGAALVTLQWYSNFRNRKTNSTKLNAETKFTSLNPMSILHSQAMLRPFKCCVQSRAMGSHIESSFSTYLRHGVILTERLCFCIL
jgi:hypothetical protein